MRRKGVKRARQELQESTVDRILENAQHAIRMVRARYSVVESLINGDNDDVSTALTLEVPVAEVVQLRRAVECATDRSSVEAVVTSTSVGDMPEVDVLNVLEASKTLVSDIDCERGVLAEAHVVRERGIASSQCTFRRVLQMGDQSVVLFGKTDGVTEGGIPVEIKNRRTKIFRRHWPQETVQMHVYMYMAKTDTCVFIESCKGHDVFEQVVEWDNVFWQDVVCKLQPVVSRISSGCR